MLEKLDQFSFNHADQIDRLYEVMTTTQMKQLFDSRGEELRTALNKLINDLETEVGASNIGMTPIAALGSHSTVKDIINRIIEILKSTTDGISGADFISATPIAELEGFTVQALLESLKKFIDDYKNELNSNTGANKVKTSNGNTVQQEINRVEGLANGAVTTSNEAKDIANTANNRVNNIVSSTPTNKDAEIVDMRFDALNNKTYQTAGKRIDDITSQLAEKAAQIDLGDKTQLTTTDKTSIVNSINEVKLQANTNQTGLTTANSNISTLQSQVTSLASGAPKAVSLASQMTDTTKNYVYAGSEGGYTAGNWYYYNGSAWVSGGVYQSTAIAPKSVTEQEISIIKTDNQFYINTITGVSGYESYYSKTGSSITVKTNSGNGTIRLDGKKVKAGTYRILVITDKAISNYSLAYTLNGNHASDFTTIDSYTAQKDITLATDQTPYIFFYYQFGLGDTTVKIMISPITTITKADYVDSLHNELTNNIFLKEDNVVKNARNILYFSSSGNDANIGSRESPKKDYYLYSNVDNVELYLKSGDIFYQPNKIFYLGTNSAIKTYGGTKKAIISGWVDITSVVPTVNGSIYSYQLPLLKGTFDTCNIGSLIINGEKTWQRKLNSSDMAIDHDFYIDYVNGILQVFSTTIIRTISYSSLNHGIWIQNNNSIVDNIEITGYSGHGIWTTAGDTIKIINNYIHDIGGALTNATTKYGNGIELYLNAGLSNVLVENNLIENVYDAGITPQGTATTTSHDITIRNNTIRNCSYLVEYFNNSESGTITKILIEKNILLGCKDITNGNRTNGTQSMAFFNIGVCQLTDDIIIRTNFCIKSDKYAVYTADTSALVIKFQKNIMVVSNDQYTATGGGYAGTGDILDNIYLTVNTVDKAMKASYYFGLLSLYSQIKTTDDMVKYIA